MNRMKHMKLETNKRKAWRIEDNHSRKKCTYSRMFLTNKSGRENIG